MRSCNSVILRGRTTSDVELLKTPNDISYCVFKVAVDRPYKKNTERKTDFIYVKAFRGTAEFICEYIKKGTMVGVTGEIRASEWDSNGEHKYRMEIVADAIEFVGGKSNKNPSNDEVIQTDKYETTGVSVDINDEEEDLPF